MLTSGGEVGRDETDESLGNGFISDGRIPSTTARDLSSLTFFCHIARLESHCRVKMNISMSEVKLHRRLSMNMTYPE